MAINFQGQDVDNTDLISKRKILGGSRQLPPTFSKLTCVVTAKIHLPKNEFSPFDGQIPIIFNTIFWTIKLRMRLSIDSFLLPIVPRSDSYYAIRFPRATTLLYFPPWFRICIAYTTKVTPTYVHIAPSHVFDLLFTRTRTILRADKLIFSYK